MITNQLLKMKWFVLLGIVAFTHIGGLATAGELTVRDGRVDQDGKVSGDKDKVSADKIEVVGTTNPVTNVEVSHAAPGTTTFDPFRGSEKKTYPYAKRPKQTDIQGEPGVIMTPEAVKETPTLIEVKYSLAGATNAAQRNVYNEGNLTSGGGSGGTGGKGMSWKAEVQAPVVKIVCTPRVVMADATSDVPLFFEIEGVTSFKVEKITVQFFVDEIRRVKFVTESAFIADDAVTKKLKDLSGKKNGEDTGYTVFIPISEYREFDLGEIVASRVCNYKIEVQGVPDGGKSVTLKSKTQKIQAFSDKRWEVIELGNLEQIAAYKPTTFQKRINNGGGKAFLIHRKATLAGHFKLPHYDLPNGTTSTKQVEYPVPSSLISASGFDFEDRSKIESASDYFLFAHLYDDADFLPSNTSGNRYTSEFIGEERGVYFSIYYGNRKIKDLAGNPHDVVFVQKKSGSITVDLFPGSTFTYVVGELDDTPTIDWTSIGTTGFWTAVGVIAVLDPEPSSKWAAFLAFAQGLTTAIDSANPTDTNEVAFSTSWGGLSIQNPDGTLLGNEFVATSLGGPGTLRSTQATNGGKTKPGNVSILAKSADVLQGWRIFNTGSVSVTTTARAIFPEEVKATLGFNFPPGFSSPTSCTVQTTAHTTAAEGECNEGE